MVQDCPVCGLANPPSAVRCDCGYDFTSREIRGSYLTDKDVARLNDDARNAPRAVIPVPGGCLGVLFFAVLFRGTNVPGAGLGVVSMVLGVAVGMAAGGPWVGVAAAGLAGIGIDLLVRRASPGRPIFDTTRQSQVMFLPLWLVCAVLLVGELFVGLIVLLVNYT